MYVLHVFPVPLCTSGGGTHGALQAVDNARTNGSLRLSMWNDLQGQPQASRILFCASRSQAPAPAAQGEPFEILFSIFLILHLLLELLGAYLNTCNVNPEALSLDSLSWSRQRRQLG